MVNQTRLPPGLNRNSNVRGSIKEIGTFVGIVKKIDDSQRMGRLSVWIPEIGGYPEDPASWIIVGYASPFFGSTNVRSIDPSSQAMEGTQTSYGFWAVPPDVGNEVLVCFANGELSRGFWFACVPQQAMNHMVPGIASNYSTDPSWKQKGVMPPVAEYNKSNVGSVTDPERPTYTPLADALNTQGLIKDYERGPSSSSARRDATSKVMGLLTPRGSNIVFDDNEQNEFIRLRTRNGAQILINNTTGYIYMITKNGDSWMELSDTAIDVYSKNSVNIRAEGDVNVRSDSNIVLDAGKDIYMRAGGKLTVGAKSLDLGIGTNMTTSVGGYLSLQASGELTFKSGSNISMDAAESTTSKSGGLNIRSASSIKDNSGTAPDVADREASLPQGKPTGDVVSSGGALSSALRDTVSSRMPTHEPFKGHPRGDIPNAQGQIQNDGGAGNGQTNGDGKTVPGAVSNDQQCSAGVGKAAKLSDTQFSSISEAAAKTGIPLSTALAIGHIESGGYNRAFYGASTHDAKGMMQIQDATYTGLVKKYGAEDGVGLGDRLDDRGSAFMGVRYMAEQSDSLKKMGVANPTGGQIYGMYNVGPGGFGKLLKADPNALAQDVIGEKNARGNPQFYYDSATKQPLTVAQTMAKYNDHVGSLENAYASQNGMVAPCQRNAATAASGSQGGSGGPSGLADQPKLQQAVANGTPVGTGQCVALVQATAGVGRTSTWGQGDAIQGNTALQPGTPIATFQGGTYNNNTDGTSHAAIYQSQNDKGMYVVDQYSGASPKERFIPWSGGRNVVGTGSNYSVITKRNA